MLNRIKNLGKDELMRGSLVLFIMFGIYNVLNYVFQISMARMLGPADYGILAVLMSIIYIFGIPSEAIQTVITKYTARFGINNDFGKVKDLLFRSIRKGFIFATASFILLIPLSFLLSYFLNIKISLLIFSFSFIFFVFLVSINRGVLQGRKKFAQLGINLVLESFVKVIFSIFLVSIGWRLYGAIVGVLIGGLLSFILTFIIIKDVLAAKRERAEFYKIYETNFPILVAMISIVLMYSLDIIFARAFFSPQVAGEFAFVSLIGKVIIFISSSIGKTMFPLSSQEFEKGKNTFGLFKKAALLVFFISSVALVFYYFLPVEIISLVSLGSSQYLGAAGVLFILGISYTLLSISNIIVLYNLSINKIVKRAYFLPTFVLIQISLLLIFNNNLIEFAVSLLVSNLLIFLYSLFLLRK